VCNSRTSLWTGRVLGDKMTQSYDKETCTIPIEEDFGWRRSWISIPVAVLALGAGLALVGYIANHVVESVAKLIGLLLGIGG
jgi:hypothetical protein